MKKLINDSKNKLNNNKKAVQKVTAWSFLGATAVNFANNQTLATLLGIIAGVSFFVDVVIIKEKKKGKL